MKNEFTKITNSAETRYILESDGGTTSAAAVGSGSVVKPLGGVRRRGDNLLAQEADKNKVPATTPRNFVAKNAKTSGAGAHVDKKKAEKQGNVKHKKPFAEGDVEESGLQYHTGVKKHGEKYMKMAAAAGRKGASQAEIGRLRDRYSKAYKKGVAEGSEDKIKQLKQDYATAVHWSKNEKSPQKREAARQKAEKIKAHLEKQYKQGVAEGSLNEDPGFDVVKSLVSAFNDSVSGDANIPLAAERPGSRVFTRSDGTRYRDHGNIRFYQGYIDPQDVDKWKATKPVEKFWDWLKSQPGVKPIGQVSGEFRQDAMRDAVAYKGQYFVLTPNGSVIWGSVSRFKNPRSVWRQQGPDQGVAEGLTDDPRFQKAMGNIVNTTPRAVVQYPSDLIPPDASPDERDRLSTPIRRPNAKVFQKMLNNFLDMRKDGVDTEEALDNIRYDLEQSDYEWTDDEIASILGDLNANDIPDDDRFESQGVAEGLNKKQEATRRIQKMLNDKFGANLDVDGVLGPLTLKSINKFMPNAKVGPAEDPNKTTAVQGKKVKNEDTDQNQLAEKWSQKYKSSINCSNPKGFSQRAHCDGKNKNEDVAETAEYNYSNINDDDWYEFDSEGNVVRQSGPRRYELPFGSNKTIKLPNGNIAAKGMTAKRLKLFKNLSESREYYNVMCTDAKSLRQDFNMSKDRHGWFLKEGSTPKQKLDVYRAFGSPKLKEYNLAAFSGGTQTKGEDNVISPVGSQTRAQYKK